MNAQQQRVVDEHATLERKLFNLHSFLDTLPFVALSDIQKSLLRDQAVAMRAYSNVLAQRIRDFKGEAPVGVQTLSISKTQLRDALEQWEIAARAGNWFRPESCTPREHADNSIDYLWNQLTKG